MTATERFQKWWCESTATGLVDRLHTLSEVAETVYCQAFKDATAWIPITERMPEPGVPVIALVNPKEYGKKRRIRAQWAPAKTLELALDAEGGIYDEETDKYYCEEGWYETNEYEEVHWNVSGTVTHWQPLPAYPEEEAKP